MPEPTPDTLTAAAERARESLILAALDAVKCIPDGEIRAGCTVYDGQQVRDRLKDAVLAARDALAAPASTVDRAMLIAALEAADDGWADEVGAMGGISDGYRAHLVDALLSAGYVTTRARMADRPEPVSQATLAECLRDLIYRGEQVSQYHAMQFARHVLAAFDVRVKAEPPAEGGGQDG